MDRPVKFALACTEFSGQLAGRRCGELREVAADERPRPGFTRKLSSFLFGEQEPVAESEGVVVEAGTMREQGELAPAGVVVEAEAMWEQEELEPEC